MLNKPPSGWASVVLAGMMLLTVAWSIEAAQPWPGIGILTPVVIGGVIVGAILGAQQRLPTGLCHAWSMVTGILTTVVAAAFAIHTFETAPAAALAQLSTYERMEVVRDWYLAWIELVRMPTPSYEAIQPTLAYAPAHQNDLAHLFFAVTMAMLIWLLSYICTWFIVRYMSWWGAVLPSGFALVFNLVNAPSEERHLVYLTFFLLCALLLATQTYLALQTQRWRRERVGYSPDIGLDFLRDGLIVAVAVLGLSWLLPSQLASTAVRDFMRQLTASPQRTVAQRVNQWFPNLAYPTRGGGNAFGSEIGLQGALQLGDAVIFDATLATGSPAPRYWRQAVFDTYDGTGWKRTAAKVAEGAPGALDIGVDYALTVPVTQTITTYQPATTQLYAAPQPDRFDLPIRTEAAESDLDVLTVESVAPLAAQSRYTAVSRLSRADVESLRNAGDADPGWIRERYLQVPDSLPERVRDLSAQLTVGAVDRFDAAAAIEAYLRQIPYSESINTPPEGIDRVEWFLFDEQRGYCDYYSSAFVMLARAAGIPARVAAGYATGERQPDGITYRQRAYNAHTWPEVYFPQFGWVEFEPTGSAGHPPIDRPANLAEAAGENAQDPSASVDETTDFLPEDERMARGDAPAPGQPAGAAAAPAATTSLPIGTLLAIAAAIAAIAGLGWVTWERPLRGLSPAEGMFARLVRVASWLGLRPRPSDTPHEYGERLAASISDTDAEISTIVDAYVRERFGRRPSADGESGRLASAWRSVRDRLVRAAMPLGWRRVKRRR